MKQLLIVYHTQTGLTEALARAALDGARDPAIAGIEPKLLRAVDARVPDLMQADALILGTPENFGYMSGGLKDFFDRTFYPCEGRLQGLPYAVLISAGNDGTGAHNAIKRIAKGFPLKEVHPALIVKGEIEQTDLTASRELGMALAAGLEMGVF